MNLFYQNLGIDCYNHQDKELNHLNVSLSTEEVMILYLLWSVIMLQRKKNVTGNSESSLVPECYFFWQDKGLVEPKSQKVPIDFSEIAELLTVIALLFWSHVPLERKKEKKTRKSLHSKMTFLLVNSFSRVLVCLESLQ